MAYNLPLKDFYNLLHVRRCGAEGELLPRKWSQIRSQAGQVFLIKNFHRTRRGGGAQLQLLISIPYIPGLIPSIGCEGICTVDNDSSVGWGR